MGEGQDPATIDADITQLAIIQTVENLRYQAHLPLLHFRARGWRPCAAQGSWNNQTHPSVLFIDLYALFLGEVFKRPRFRFDFANDGFVFQVFQQDKRATSLADQALEVWLI